MEGNKKIYFSDYFCVSHDLLNEYGAFDISLVTDSPAFVDPFLIYYSDKKEYKELYKFILDYLGYLKYIVDTKTYPTEIRNFLFKEVEQVWLGYSSSGNKGSGLGKKFASSLIDSLGFIVNDNGITETQHIEKLSMLGDRVGADKISDFTINLIKGYLVSYTEKFAINNIDKSKISKFTIAKGKFDFDLGEWVNIKASLPYIIDKTGKEQYILLTPKDLLVKNEGWISKNDFLNKDSTIIEKIENKELRDKVNKLFLENIPLKYNKRLKKNVHNLTKKNTREALRKVTKKHPILFDYYMQEQEKRGELAVNANKESINELEAFGYQGVNYIVTGVKDISSKYHENSVIDSVLKFKYFMESRGGDKVFWKSDILQHTDERIVQFMLDLVLSSTMSGVSVDKEVDNGRGPVDFKVSQGEISTLVEVKLAKNKQIKKNLENQLKIYMQANNTDSGIYVIVFFTEKEKEDLYNILESLNMLEYIDKKIFIIDCTKKISASKVK